MKGPARVQLEAKGNEAFALQPGGETVHIYCQGDFELTLGSLAAVQGSQNPSALAGMGWHEHATASSMGVKSS